MSLDGYTVLLAEDNPTNQLVAVQMLESLGARVTLAADGQEALRLLSGGAFDLGLIDIQMPKLSGLDVIEAVRASPAPLARMPLIALTAYVMLDHREALDRAGADGVIAKPILSIEGLSEEIRSILSRSEPSPSSRARPDPADGGTAFDPAILENLRTSIGTDGLDSLLRNVLEDFAFLRAQALTALEGQDLETLRRVTHSLIPVASVVGAVGLESCSCCLNSAAQGEDYVEASRIGARLVSEIDAAAAFVGARLRQ